MSKQTIGAFQVEAGFCGMSAGHFLTVALPSGRVVVIYDEASESELQGGESVLEVYPNQDDYDDGVCENPGYKQIGF